MSEVVDYPTPPLSDGVVSLRPWEHADIAAIEEASRDPRIPASTTVPGVYTEERGREFIERQWGRRDHDEGLSLAVADVATGEAVGLIVLLHREDRSVLGIGYWIIPKARSKSFAWRAVRLLVPWALSHPGVTEVEAIVEAENDPSLRVLRRATFVDTGDAEVDGRAAFRLTRKSL